MKRIATALVLVSTLFGGCATAQNPDPIEPWNRGVFAINEMIDVAVIKPVATVYRDTVPSPMRRGVTNFFGNIKDVWSATNLFMQGRVRDGFSDVARFGTNTVFGALGLFDVASELGFERHGEDLGQTLGHWGVPAGAYIVWPLLGPSTLRDSLDIPFDTALSPSSFVSPESAAYALTGFRLVSARADLIKTTDLIDQIALDKYTFVRDAHLQRRRNLIYDGSPPDQDDDGLDKDSSDDSELSPPAAAPQGAVVPAQGAASAVADPASAPR
jgi:phospholipid-binding lipoprotein MlaA